MVSITMNLRNHTVERGREVILAWAFLLPYVCTNLLFVAKYAPRQGIPPLVACVIYGALATGVLWAACCGAFDRLLRSTGVYTVAVLTAAVLLLLLMLQFDPEGIRNGRYWAVHEWLGRMSHGFFPYASPHLHTGFPFLFVLMLPFYLMGDVGLLQVCTFVMLAYIFRRGAVANASAGILLLLVAPAFLYEIAVRSDLFSNIAILIFFLYLLDAILQRPTNHRWSAMGLAAGLLLATRAVSFLVWIAYLGYVIRRRPRAALQLLAYSIAAFLAAIVPFWIWDARGFVAEGPFMTELTLSQLSLPWIAALIIGAAVTGLLADSLAAVLTAIGFTLFAAAVIPFFQCLWSAGLTWTIWRDGFDISYFCFSLPPLLAGFVLRRVPGSGCSSELGTC